MIIQTKHHLMERCRGMMKQRAPRKQFLRPIISRRPKLTITLFILGFIFAITLGWRMFGTQPEASLSPTAGLHLSDRLRDDIKTFSGVVEPGQTASDLLSPFLTTAEIHELAEQSREIYPLSMIRAGKPYRVSSQGNELISFEYEVSSEEILTIGRETNGFSFSLVPIRYEVKYELVRGVIENNLFNAVAAAGEGPELAVELADIFAWDVDFCRDIRSGDSFKAFVEKRFRRGQLVGYGRIKAAEFSNQGETFQAFYFETQGGQGSYFDANGKSLRKMFLKAPLPFFRISSGYSYSRYHPVLHYRRPHYGIDYAAPTGTPVWTVGQGSIAAMGFGGETGRYVRVRHNSVYQTQYNHLSRFASNLRQGSSVSQGQVIGYVGSTGLASGPHLDFRMYTHGSPVNPTRLKFPSADPVSQSEKERFLATIDPMIDLLNNPQKHTAQVASAESKTFPEIDESFLLD